MIRKQLYLRNDQDAALKALARRRGVSEAELVRQAVDELVAAGTHRGDDLESFLASARKLSKRHRLERSWRFDRAEANSRR